MSWASRRRGLYFSIVFIVVIGIVAVLGYAFFYEEPTCFDGKQNGLEEGIDCGGGCEKVCSFSAAKPIVQWGRLFEVIPGVYSVLALVENPNTGVAARNLSYTFKLRGADNLLVHEQKGTMYLPPNAVVPVFATGIQTGSRIPTRVEFTVGNPTWVHEPPSPIDISIDRITLEKEGTAPRLTARLTNHSLESFPVFPLVAILYGADENALHASQTILRDLEGSAEIDLVFTWPQPLEAPVGQISIIPVPQER